MCVTALCKLQSPLWAFGCYFCGGNELVAPVGYGDLGLAPWSFSSRSLGAANAKGMMFFSVVRHLRNGAAIARCSQPEISWWGWRNADDEYLVTSIAKACALDPGTRAAGGSLSTGNNDSSEACDTDFGKVWVVLAPLGVGPYLGLIGSQGVLRERMGRQRQHTRCLGPCLLGGCGV